MKKNYTHVSFVLDNSQSMHRLKEVTLEGYNTFIAKQKEDPGSMTFSLFQFTPGPFLNGLLNPGLGVWSQTMVAPPVVAPLTTGAITGLANCVPFVVPPSVPNYGRGSVGIYEVGGAGVQTTYEFKDIQTIPALDHETYKCESYTPLLDAIGEGIVSTGKVLASLAEEDRPSKVIFVILTDGAENKSIHYTRPAIAALIKEQTEKYNWEFVFLGANQDAIAVGGSYGIARGSSMTYAATVDSTLSTYNALSASVTASKVSGMSVNFSDDTKKAVLDGTLKS